MKVQTNSGATQGKRATRRRSLTIGLSALALVLGVLVAGCATTPRAVLNVPGNYVADLWQPTLQYPSGGPTATVIMCLNEESAVHLETGEGGEGAVGIIELTWAGQQYSASASGDPVTLTTPVLQPGCGTLVFGVDCCHVDHYLAIKATKV